MVSNPCPCHSGKEYGECCKVFHEGKPADNALLLMRSRYAAYALNIPDYIIGTTHPASPQYLENKSSWKKKISEFSSNCSFDDLTIHDFKENNSLATVTFTAHLSQNGKDASFSEMSMFEKINDRWLYRSGQIAK